MIKYYPSSYVIVFFMLMIYMNQGILSKSIESSLISFSTGFLNFLNHYDKFGGRIIQLASNVELTIVNVKASISSETYKINTSANTIDYNNFNVTLIYDINLSLLPPNTSLDIPGRKLIIIKDYKITFHLKYPLFRFYRRFDNSFEYDSYLFYSFREHSLGKLKDYEFFQEIIRNYDEYLFGDELVSMWYELVDQVLIIYPLCDALYIYNEVTKLLISSGYKNVNCEDPNFTRIRFLSFSYDSIEAVPPFARKFKGLKIKIDYKLDLEYGIEVFFQNAIITRNEILFGEMSPQKEILQKVIIFFVRQAVLQIIEQNK